MGLKPQHLLILLLVVILLFGARKLPDLARSMGRSLRIIKAETKGLVDEPDPDDLDEKAEPRNERRPLADESGGGTQAGSSQTGKAQDGKAQTGEVVDPPERVRDN